MLITAKNTILKTNLNKSLQKERKIKIKKNVLMSKNVSKQLFSTQIYFLTVFLLILNLKTSFTKWWINVQSKPKRKEVREKMVETNPSEIDFKTKK